MTIAIIGIAPAKNVFAVHSVAQNIPSLVLYTGWAQRVLAKCCGHYRQKCEDVADIIAYGGDFSLYSASWGTKPYNYIFHNILIIIILFPAGYIWLSYRIYVSA